MYKIIKSKKNLLKKWEGVSKLLTGTVYKNFCLVWKKNTALTTILYIFHFHWSVWEVQSSDVSVFHLCVCEDSCWNGSHFDVTEVISV